jgi:uncharacterized protein (TIGR03437 family)
MIRSVCAFLFCGALLFSQQAPAQSAPAVVITSSASGSAGLAPESLASLYGANVTTQTAPANGYPWPTTLAGVQLQFTDSAKVTRPAGLIYVSPSQINFEVPAGTAPGPGTVTVANITVPVQVGAVAPAIFSANGDGKGVAAATAVRVLLGSHIQGSVQVFQCGNKPGSCTSVPIDTGLDTPVYLSLYGTGIRGRSSLSNVMVTIGGMPVPVLYAGAQPEVPGLDQVNAGLTLGLRGSGEVDVVVTVDGVSSNAVRVNIK